MVWLAVLLLLIPPAAAASTWLRVDRPDAALRVLLPPEAIDYGRFAWVPEAAAPGLAARAGTVRMPNPFVLTAGDRRFDPVRDFPAGRSPWFTGAGHPGADFHLIQFQGPIKGEWLDQLRRIGVEPVQYLHPFTYVVWAEPGRVSAARGLSRVRWTGEMLPAFRVPPQSRDPAWNHPHGMALIYRPVEDSALDALSAAGARIERVSALNQYFILVQFESEPEAYLDLARIAGIYTVQQITPDGGPRGEMTNQAVVGNYDANNLIFPGYLDWLVPTGLDGSGVRVGVVDNGIQETHQDLAGNLAECVDRGGELTSCLKADMSHGTHVAGAIAGTGASGTLLNGFLRGQGIAPGATLVQQHYPPFLSSGGPGAMVPGGMLTIFGESAASGTVLVNNSWGPTSTPQGYDIPTMQVDMITRDADPESAVQQPLLAIWAIMNGSGDSSGACAPSSLGSPEEAKNLLAVGSTRLMSNTGAQLPGIFDLSANSGHGPACDGRTVPHLVAPGCHTDSTVANSSNDAHSFNFCGTSMAAPVVAGAAALLWEQYRQATGTDPSPALVKAVLTGAARNLAGFLDADGEILGQRPDRRQGWGRLDLDALINRPDNLWTLDQTEILTTTGESWSRDFAPEDPDKPMAIMLAWTDAPGHGQGGSAPAWVNDLDLIVDAGLQTYFGNQFDSADGFSAAGGTPDGKNNLEGVMLRPDQHLGGPVAVDVLAANLAGDGLDPWDPDGQRQDFALACYNCLTGPDFTLRVSPDAAAVCQPDEASFAIGINQLDGFDDPVELSLAQQPDQTTGTFTPDTVIPAGSSQLDLAIGPGAPVGVHDLVIAASSSTGTRQRTVRLGIFDEPPQTPKLLDPANQADDVSPAPTFSWAGSEPVDEYLLVIATDPAFGQVIWSGTTGETSLTPDLELEPATEYFWQVRATNPCGSRVSQTFRFVTSPAPGQCGLDESVVTVFADDLEQGAPGWMVESDNGAVNNTWQLSDARAVTGQLAWHAEALGETSDQRLVSPEIVLPGNPVESLTLSFFNWQEIEAGGAGNCLDAAVLEITTDGGETWTQLPEERLLTQPYDGPVSTGNPLAGQPGWCGDPAPWTDNVVDLSPHTGQTIRLRFRLATDTIIGREGWYVDDVRVRGCSPEIIFADRFESM